MENFFNIRLSCSGVLLRPVNPEVRWLLLVVHSGVSDLLKISGF